MSVTFWCPEAPRKPVPCQFCQGEYVDFPKGNGRGGKCDRFCTGFENVSEAPEVNMGSGNAGAILSLLDIPSGAECGEPCGEVVDIADFRRRIVRARNANRSHLEADYVELPGGHAGVAVIEDEDGLPRIQRMGARMISFGNTDDQTVRRLEALDRLATWAQANNQRITWG